MDRAEFDSLDVPTMGTTELELLDSTLHLPISPLFLRDANFAPLCDRYLPESCLGVGGQGVVLGARDLEPPAGEPRRVAIKVVRLEDCDKLEELIARTRHEYEVGRALSATASHAAFVRMLRIHSTFATVNESKLQTVVLVMERLFGCTLESARNHPAIPWRLRTVLRLGANIARALAVLHARSIVHRDINPNNIWLNCETFFVPGTKLPPWSVKLMDYGLARNIGFQPVPPRRYTGNDLGFGTAPYRPLWQCVVETNDLPSNDLYALAVTLHELLFRTTPTSIDALAPVGPMMPAWLRALFAEMMLPPRDANVFASIDPGWPTAERVARILDGHVARKPAVGDSISARLSKPARRGAANMAKAALELAGDTAQAQCLVKQQPHLAILEGQVLLRLGHSIVLAETRQVLSALDGLKLKLLEEHGKRFGTVGGMLYGSRKTRMLAIANSVLNQAKADFRIATRIWAQSDLALVAVEGLIGKVMEDMEACQRMLRRADDRTHYTSAGVRLSLPLTLSNPDDRRDNDIMIIGCIEMLQHYISEIEQALSRLQGTASEDLELTLCRSPRVRLA